jgi:hypothetical protein
MNRPCYPTFSLHSVTNFVSAWADSGTRKRSRSQALIFLYDLCCLSPTHSLSSSVYTYIKKWNVGLHVDLFLSTDLPAPHKHTSSRYDSN